MQQSDTNTDINGAVRAIYLRQKRDLASFIAEWTTTGQKDGHLLRLDAIVRLLAECYAAELDRLLAAHPASTEWLDVVESAQLLRAAAMNRLKKSPTLTSLPLSSPVTLADRTYEFLVAAMYQFASCVGVARKQSPAA